MFSLHVSKITKRVEISEMHAIIKRRTSRASLLRPSTSLHSPSKPSLCLNYYDNFEPNINSYRGLRACHCGPRRQRGLRPYATAVGACTHRSMWQCMQLPYPTTVRQSTAMGTGTVAGLAVLCLRGRLGPDNPAAVLYGGRCGSRFL
jgi:hypothetical protein